ncbi:hypothetical protein E0H47_25465 [Rhizobium leguminosarum bv. viciae]|uniref:hypothetical protein n=1 Tax=Rhizobium leguminosarum TaxID=384 RepID=UPI00103E0406|nr:hypothetical protein [Rhizobium leguminosarum]TBZ35092.1 hypothetical protein E0H47_25465 [Rhizobium leguminosarum bv. viciae]
MAVAARANRMTRGTHRHVAKRGSVESHQAKVVARSSAEVDDYNGMELEEWKAALRKDVAERFGPVPDNLVSAGEAGW